MRSFKAVIISAVALAIAAPAFAATTTTPATKAAGEVSKPTEMKADPKSPAKPDAVAPVKKSHHKARHKSTKIVGKSAPTVVKS